MSMAALQPCGTIHSTERMDPPDPNGCLLPIGHSGPHRFKSSNGQTYEWESDLECSDCDPDECECTVYWRSAYRE